MRMTVGPLPPAVYWRRRAIVLAALLAVVVGTVWACDQPAEPTGRHAAPGRSHRPGGHSGMTDAPPSGSTSGSASPTPTTSAPAAGSGDGDPVGAAAPPPAADSKPAPHCADDALTVQVRTAAKRIPMGSSPAFYLTIGNDSAAACTRDIGADEQELAIRRDDRTVWSSDYCDANHGSDVRRFDPGVHVTYRLVWDGRSAGKGCRQARTMLPRGSYELVGRVGSKHARPYPFTLT